MNVGLTGVLSIDKLALVPDTVRSRVSESTVEIVAARELASLDFRDSAGEVASGSVNLSLESLDFVFSLIFSLLLLNNVVNDGAAGLSFGVEACCDDAGRVPMGACIGRMGFLSGSMTMDSFFGSERLLVEACTTDGRREWFREKDWNEPQSGASGLFRIADFSGFHALN